jgi:hypothetical protein
MLRAGFTQSPPNDFFPGSQPVLLPARLVIIGMFSDEIIPVSAKGIGVDVLAARSKREFSSAG